MLAIRNSQSNHYSGQESSAQSEHVIISEEEIVQRVQKYHPGYIKEEGKIIIGSSSFGDGQNENVELVRDLQR